MTSLRTNCFPRLHGAWGAAAYAVACAVLFVASLYVRGNVRTHRDDPREIKRRMVAVSVAATSLLLVLAATYDGTACDLSFWALVGVRFDASAVLRGVAAPMLLVATLFAGPLLQEYRERDTHEVGATRPWWHWSLHELRNVLFAPLFEEIVFRALACAALRVGGGWSVAGTVALSSALFGLAHAHHVVHHVLVEHVPLARALLLVGFQFAYTFLFGAFVGYVYVQTGLLLTAFLLHAFCNRMGVPDFGGARDDALVGAVYVVGLVAFSLAFTTLTAAVPNPLS